MVTAKLIYGARLALSNGTSTCDYITVIRAVFTCSSFSTTNIGTALTKPTCCEIDPREVSTETFSMAHIFPGTLNLASMTIKRNHPIVMTSIWAKKEWVLTPDWGFLVALFFMIRLWNRQVHSAISVLKGACRRVWPVVISLAFSIRKQKKTLESLAAQVDMGTVYGTLLIEAEFRRLPSFFFDYRLSQWSGYRCHLLCHLTIRVSARYVIPIVLSFLPSCYCSETLRTAPHRASTSLDNFFFCECWIVFYECIERCAVD